VSAVRRLAVCDAARQLQQPDFDDTRYRLGAILGLYAYRLKTRASIERPSVSPSSFTRSPPRRPIVRMCRSAADSSVLRCTFWETNLVPGDTSSRWWAHVSRRLRRHTSSSINTISECYSIATMRAFSGCRGWAIRLGGTPKVSSNMPARRITCSRCCTRCSLRRVRSRCTSVISRPPITMCDWRSTSPPGTHSRCGPCGHSASRRYCSSSEGRMAPVRNCSNRPSRGCPSQPFITT